MALGTSHQNLLAAIDEYGFQARRANRKQGVLQALDMLRESVSTVVQSKLRRQEEERARQDRQRETEESRKYEQTEYERRRLVQRGEALSDAERKSREEQEQQQALAEANAPKVQQINKLFRQAIQSKDENAYYEALSQYTELDETFQKKIPFSTYEKKFEKTMEPPKEEKKIGAAQQALIAELQQRADASKDPDERLGYLSLIFAVESGEGIATVVKEMRELAANSAEQPEMPEITTGPQRTAAAEQGFDIDERKALTPAGMGLQRGAELFGVPGFEANVDQFGEPFISPGAVGLQGEFLEAEIASNAIEKKMFPDTPQGRAMAKAYARAKLGKPDAIERVLNGDVQTEEDVPAVTEEEMRQLEAEIRQRYPDLDTLLQNDEFREALDDEYEIHGLSDFLSMNKMSYDAGL